MKINLRIPAITIKIIWAGIILQGCIDQTYDLKNGVNTIVTLGGDSLTVPVLQKTWIYLDSMMNSQDISLLKRMQDGTYSLHLHDSISAPFNAIQPVSISLNPVIPNPISLNINPIQWSEFKIDPISYSTSLTLPEIDINRDMAQPINEVYTQGYTISGMSQVKGLSKVKAGTVIVGLFRKTINRTINESFFYQFPKELKKINKVYFTNTKITLTFDKTQINELGLIWHNDTIKGFRMDFPPEYRLSNATGMNARIDGNSFVIDETPLTKGVNIFTASFNIESVDLSDVYQYESLTYNKSISYSLDYSFMGETDNYASVADKNIQYTISLQATPQINDADIVTNDMSVVIPANQISINKSITGIPPEVAEIHSVTLKTGAYLQLNVPDPGISPFSFNNSSGNCQIQLPTKMIFRPYDGLDTATNILTLPASAIFGTKNIPISGFKLNQSIAGGQTSFNYTDRIGYMVTGLTIGSQITTINAIKSLSGKNFNFSGMCTGMIVQNAAVKTRGITATLPRKSIQMNINKYISTSVKRIYSSGFKTPVGITLKFTANGLPASVDSIYFKNFIIQLPAWLKFRIGDVNAQNQMILNEGFRLNNGFSKTLTLEKIDFGINGKTLDNGNINITDSVIMQGNIFINGAEINSADIGTIQIQPSITFNKMELAVFEGEIQTSPDPVIKDFKLSLPDFVKSDSAKLDLENPVITLDIANSLGMGIDANVTILPKQNGRIISGAQISHTITIAPAVQPGIATTTKIWIARTNDGGSSGYQAIVIPELGNLLQVAPDELEISIGPSITGTRQSVDLSSTVDPLTIKYTFNVPLAFGAGFRINYNDTIVNLHAAIAQLIKYTRQVEINSVVNNTIPLNMHFDVIPMDSANHVLSGIQITTSDSVKSCNLDGTSQSSQIKIKVNETSAGTLDKLDRLAVKIWATKNSTIAGMPLKTNQFITLEMNICIPNGITLTTASTQKIKSIQKIQRCRP